MADGLAGDPGVPAPELVVEDHRDDQEHVPTRHQEMKVPTAKEVTFKFGNAIQIAVQVMLLSYVVLSQSLFQHPVSRGQVFPLHLLFPGQPCSC